ncbi:MAG: polysaccharide pyruvyl transferase CsaB [Armatimonadetes bacterium]|nr:polysaccharide pyruvyl transferase CsaB [Armatimonadota bacterium]MBS1726108.1 polysaccharide pyruvyl transferase CsaB [Armatimonadota bacterium]
MARIVLAGYIGCGNLGDDSVMIGVVDGLGVGHEYLVLSGDPDDTFRYYAMHGVPRKNLKEVEAAIKASDALVFPGGSIFQDVTSAKSTVYYTGLIKMAKKHNKRVLLLNQGVGPLNTWIGKNQTRTAMSLADLIVVRDPGSLKTLTDLGVNKKIHVGADSALILREPVREDDGSSYGIGAMKAVALAPRPWKRKGVDIIELFGETSRLLFNAGFVPTLVEMDPFEDGKILEAITKQQGGRIPFLRNLGSSRMVQFRLARMEGVIGMRLHAGILATTVGVPPLMLNYDPKVAAFARQIDIGPALTIEGLTAPRLFEAFMEHHKAKDAHKVVILKKREELREQAMKAIELANHFLK